MMAVVERRLRRGDPVPWWDHRPLPFEDLEWVLAAHGELATCKAIGFGAAGPIPWTAIHAYAAHHGMTVGEEEEFAAYVWAIDEELSKPDETHGN